MDEPGYRAGIFLKAGPKHKQIRHMAVSGPSRKRPPRGARRASAGARAGAVDCQNAAAASPPRGRSPEGLDALEERLADRRARRLPLGGVLVQSAVAVVLRESPRSGRIEVLLVRRAERAGDPWSGHMAFPGGRRQPEDRDLRATAERELAEETGLDVRELGARLPSGLGDLVTRAHERPVPMLVRPFLFRIAGRPTWRLGAEVSEAVWVPLDFFARAANRVSMGWRFAGVDWRVPSYVYARRRVWGLTLMVLDELVRITHGVEFPRLEALRLLERAWRRRQRETRAAD